MAGPEVGRIASWSNLAIQNGNIDEIELIWTIPSFSTLANSDILSPVESVTRQHSGGPPERFRLILTSKVSKSVKGNWFDVEVSGSLISLLPTNRRVDFADMKITYQGSAGETFRSSTKLTSGRSDESFIFPKMEIHSTIFCPGSQDKAVITCRMKLPPTEWPLVVAVPLQQESEDWVQDQMSSSALPTANKISASLDVWNGEQSHFIIWSIDNFFSILNKGSTTSPPIDLMDEGGQIVFDTWQIELNARSKGHGSETVVGVHGILYNQNTEQSTTKHAVVELNYHDLNGKSSRVGYVSYDHFTFPPFTLNVDEISCRGAKLLIRLFYPTKNHSSCLSNIIPLNYLQGSCGSSALGKQSPQSAPKITPRTSLVAKTFLNRPLTVEQILVPLAPKESHSNSAPASPKELQYSRALLGLEKSAFSLGSIGSASSLMVIERETGRICHVLKWSINKFFSTIKKGEITSPVIDLENESMFDRWQVVLNTFVMADGEEGKVQVSGTLRHLQGIRKPIDGDFRLEYFLKQSGVHVRVHNHHPFTGEFTFMSLMLPSSDDPACKDVKLEIRLFYPGNKLPVPEKVVVPEVSSDHEWAIVEEKMAQRHISKKDVRLENAVECFISAQMGKRDGLTKKVIRVVQADRVEFIKRGGYKQMFTEADEQVSTSFFVLLAQANLERSSDEGQAAMREDTVRKVKRTK